MLRGGFHWPGLLPGAVLCLLVQAAPGAEHRGVVRFAGQPVPGATVTATQHGAKRSAVTDARGVYAIDGVIAWPFAVEVEMQLFVPQRREFGGPSGATAEWDLELLPAAQLAARVVRQARSETGSAFQRTTVSEARNAAPAPAEAPTPPPDPAAAAELARQAADGFLVNGSVNNAASSPFSQFPAFGNNRRNRRSLYNGSLGFILNNSILDARSFSLTGQDTPKPSYSRVQGLLAFGGPLRIPGLLNRNGPNLTLNYQWTRNRNAATQTGLMPTAVQRSGVFTQPVTDPLTGLPFANNAIPESRISPQARALLPLFPEPNFPGNSRYNFQLPIVTGYHQDDLQTRANKQVRRNFYSGNFSWQNTRTDTPNLFGFLDTGRVNGVNATAAWRRMLEPRWFLSLSVNFNRLATRVTPYFSLRENISGEAGIGGNNQEPVNWGPPNLVFSNGITPLTSTQESLSRNQTSSISADLYHNRSRHNLAAGLTLRRQQFNVISQQDARRTFTFTGAAAGNDLAGFLLGVPDTSSIAFGNADKYLRGRIGEAYVNDDWRVNPGLTVNAGLRWEYWSTLSEKYGRLANLEIGPGFSTARPATLLPRPDRNNFAPRAGIAWRPLPASSVVIRAGYGIYYDTSLYQPIAMEMAQQPPFSKSLRLANSPATPLTLAASFPGGGAAGTPTFAVDPGFRVGYAHTWQASVQSDLPAALQVSAGYNGSKGTRGQQQILPNTYPSGAGAPSGFSYLASNGNSIRHAAQIQLRRRLRSGFTGQVQYTWSKSIDNSLLGGQGRPLIAQNWLDLRAERGLSNFDQRHLLSTGFQYTSGMGLHGGALARGRIATLLREWTLGTQIAWGTGLPLTPLYPGAIPGTGYTGILRPNYTGAPLYDAPPGFHLNPAAYAAPVGVWGNAGRNSITGPGRFSLNASLGRTFRSSDRVSLDLRLDASNATNTPTFTGWNTVAGSAQFGLPNAANPMRTVQVTVRTRF